MARKKLKHQNESIAWFLSESDRQYYQQGLIFEHIAEQTVDTFDSIFADMMIRHDSTGKQNG